MREIYMIAILNFKMSHDQYPPPTGNPQNIDLKTGDMIIIKIQTPHSTFDGKYKHTLSHSEKVNRESF